MTTIAIVAPGEMGSGVAARLVERGARVLTSLQGRGERSVERARAAGMVDVPEAELMTADLFLSIVPPHQAAEVAVRFTRLPARRHPPFIDLNAISPETAHAIAKVVTDSGARFVDGGIIGTPPRPGQAGPTLYLSGPAGEATQVLLDHGLVVRDLDGGVGAASALKMSYAGITKGLSALAASMILAAERHGAAAALATELAASQPALLERFRKTLPDMLPKAWRFAPEMREIAGFIGDGRAERHLYSAMGDFYEQLAIDLEATPDQVKAALLRFVAIPDKPSP
jgi:3-hydroxyisobutyrate dehydrogenase-like beta-hydroxyacid dehydrogenase